MVVRNKPQAAPTAPWKIRLGLDDPAKKSGEWCRRVRLSTATRDGNLASQVLLAQFLGATQLSVSNWETGKHCIPFDVTIQLLVQELRNGGQKRIAFSQTLLAELFATGAIPSVIRDETIDWMIDGLQRIKEVARQTVHAA